MWVIYNGIRLFTTATGDDMASVLSDYERTLITWGALSYLGWVSTQSARHAVLCAQCHRHFSYQRAADAGVVYQRAASKSLDTSIKPQNAGINNRSARDEAQRVLAGGSNRTHVRWYSRRDDFWCVPKPSTDNVRADSPRYGSIAVQESSALDREHGHYSCVLDVSQEVAMI